MRARRLLATVVATAAIGAIAPLAAISQPASAAPPASAPHAAAVAVGTPHTVINCDGRSEQFGKGDGDAVYHRWEKTPGGTWSGWENLGGKILYDLAVNVNSDCRVEVFVIGTSHQMYHKWQVSAGGSWTKSWDNMGGYLIGPVYTRYWVGAGLIEVWALGPDQPTNRYHNKIQTTVGGWSDWY
ncbi:MAG: hypothetical protein QOD41_187 [Cryptosporangiaceae bacterium]|nr:hypothetical protein [Cryptosporangiaceae bacterium]